MKLIAFVLVAVSLSACGDVRSSTAPTPPPVVVSTAPAVIRVLASSRSDQQIDVTATVLTSDGHLVQNVAVSFTVGAGTIAPATVTTDATGIAHALAVTPSSTTIQATAGDLHASVSVAASAPPQPPSQPPTFPPSVPTPPPPSPPPPPPLVVPSLTLTLGCSQALNTACNVSAVDETGAVVTSQLGGVVTWDFGDGSALVVGGALNTHLYPQSGTYLVRASATIGARSGVGTKIVVTP